MKQIKFKDYEEFVCYINDTFDNLDDEYGDVSIIAKYNEAKEIIKGLLCIGYNIASVELHKEEFEEYCDEYIISLNFDGIWCEKFKRDNGYHSNESTVIYIMDNCSSKVIPYCKSKHVYEVSVGTDNKNYSIAFKCNDGSETLEIINYMENRISYMDDIIREMNYFKRLFNW